MVDKVGQAAFDQQAANLTDLFAGQPGFYQPSPEAHTSFEACLSLLDVQRTDVMENVGATSEAEQVELTFSTDSAKALTEAIVACESSSFRDLSYELYYGQMRGRLTESQSLKLLGEAFSYQMTIKWARNSVKASLQPASPDWPSSFGDTPESVQLTWSALFENLANPALRSRLSDLMLTTNSRPTRTWADRVVDSVTSALNSDWDAADRYELAMRAITVSRKFNLANRLETLMEAVLTEIDDRISNGNVLHKQFLQLAKATHLELGDPSDGRSQSSHWRASHEQLWFRLEEAEPHDYAIAEILALARNESERTSVRQKHTSFELRLGELATEGFRKLHHFERAAQLAKKYDLKEAHGTAIRLMQNVPQDSIEWERVGSSFTIPLGATEREVRKIIHSDSWKNSLVSFLSLPAPTGDHEANTKQAHASAANSIRHIFRNVTVGSHGLPEKTRHSSEDAVAADLAFAEMHHVQIQGQILARGLHLFKLEFPDLTRGDIASCLVSDIGIASRSAQALAEAFEAYWKGDYQHLGTVTMFHIERVIREFSVFLELPVYRIQTGHGRGRFPSLETYLDALDEAGFDIDWNRSIRIILLSDGWNLRNLIAHGYQSTVGGVEAALILRMLGFMCLVSRDGASVSVSAGNFPTWRNPRQRDHVAALRKTRRVLSRQRRRTRRK